jgi:hypothetical protein
MLIVLLDCSRSMRERFRGEAPAGDRGDCAGGARKLDAALRVLHEALVSAPPAELAVVIGFAGRAVELARGRSIGGLDLQWRIEMAELGSETDLPAALAAAASLLRARPIPRSGGKVVLISDGLLDARLDEHLAPVVNELAGLSVAVQVVVIDPAERGLEVARRIARSRALRIVTAAGEEVLEEAAPSVAMARAMPMPVRAPGPMPVPARVPTPASADVGPLAPARDVEDVAVTIAHAPSVARGTWHSLDVFVHVASLEDEVRRIVRAERGPGGARASRDARLPRGTVVRIEPRIEHAELDIEVLEMRWREDLQRVTFRFRPAAGATELRGSIDLYVKHALWCSVPFAVAVTDEPRAAAPARIATGKMMDVVFVSYAAEERPLVEHVTRAYGELGISVLIDKDFLHAGDTPGDVLRSEIERADVFLLFWSTRASRKPWVEREWRHALTLSGPAGRKGARFIRPLVWEPSPPAWPRELAALPFARLDVAWFARSGARWGICAAMYFAAVAAALVLAAGG